MEPASSQTDGIIPAKRALWARLTRQHDLRGCPHTQSLRQRLGFMKPSVLLDSARYCIDECLEKALTEAFRRAGSEPYEPQASHRVPLGLLLLSRQQLTLEQLQHALDVQRASGRGRIGYWLQSLGFANEQQITAALGRQWSCPVLRTESHLRIARHVPQVPIALLERFRMIPVAYVESTSTLHFAFGERPDYSVLYAIEQMLGCHTEACIAPASFVRLSLEGFAIGRGEREAVFEGAFDADECARIVFSYCARITASEIRMAVCRPYIWVRLLQPVRPAIDLWLRFPQTASQPCLAAV
jgi:hypothetical protein